MNSIKNTGLSGNKAKIKIYKNTGLFPENIDERSLQDFFESLTLTYLQEEGLPRNRIKIEHICFTANS